MSFRRSWSLIDTGTVQSDIGDEAEEGTENTGVGYKVKVDGVTRDGKTRTKTDGQGDEKKEEEDGVVNTRSGDLIHDPYVRF